jgi:predicted nucleic acid-binding protein
MKIVIDANIVIAALIKNSKAREVIISNQFKFFAPDFILEEIEKYRVEIRKKANLDDEGFDIIISLLFETIDILPREEYQEYLQKAKEIMKDDIKDVTYVACFFALNCAGIWTNDSHFKDKNIKLFSTKDLLEFL